MRPRPCCTIATGSDALPGTYPAGAGTVSIGTISGPVTITGGPISVSDGGLAGATADATVALGSPEITPVLSGTLAAAGTLTLAIGAGSAVPYPPGAASWQVIAVGMAGTDANGLRLLTQYQDGAGKSISLLQEQRDTSIHIRGAIIASGLADTPAITFLVSVGAGSHFPVTVTLYMSGSELPDQFYDSAIYGPQFTGSGNALVGFDGVLWAVSGWTIATGGNQTFYLLTYRGPVLLGLQSSQAMHGAFTENDYSGAKVLGAVNNFPVSTGGGGQQPNGELAAGER